MYIKGQIGKTVKQIRLSLNLPQHEIGDKDTICHLETGAKEPSLGYCEKLASRLNIHLGQLLSTTQTSQPILIIDDFMLEVSRYVPKLSVNDKKIIIEVLEDLLDSTRRNRIPSSRRAGPRIPETTL